MKQEQLYDLIWMSRPLMQAAEACVVKGLDGTDLTVRMRAVLEILHRHGDLSVPEIAAKLEINRQYVQLMVNDTLASGLTRQRPNPRHKRSRLLSLTEDARNLIENVMSAEMALMATISAEFSEEEIATALRVVRAVTDRLKAQQGGDIT
ncbi:MarR family winged helix-turn-helix transcriptional regulator [Nioella aestuarii]|uniref:MarR family winged helix-turn-helix transcriptional regulator n=1 Tax=Nioella aestuarii TaxID=1662864 RepID=UPI003D7F1E4A